MLETDAIPYDAVEDLIAAQIIEAKPPNDLSYYAKIEFVRAKERAALTVLTRINTKESPLANTARVNLSKIINQIISDIETEEFRTVLKTGEDNEVLSSMASLVVHPDWRERTFKTQPELRFRLNLYYMIKARQWLQQIQTPNQLPQIDSRVQLQNMLDDVSDAIEYFSNQADTPAWIRNLVVKWKQKTHELIVTTLREAFLYYREWESNNTSNLIRNPSSRPLHEARMIGLIELARERGTEWSMLQERCSGVLPFIDQKLKDPIQSEN